METCLLFFALEFPVAETGFELLDCAGVNAEAGGNKPCVSVVGEKEEKAAVVEVFSYERGCSGLPAIRHEFYPVI